MRDPTPLRRDVMLVFASLVAVIAIQELRTLWADIPPATELLVTIFLLAEPYLVLRLIRHVRRLPVGMLRGVLAGFLASSGALVVLGTTSRPAVIGLIVYFVGAQIIAAGYFALEARRRAGSSRLRLALAAAATGLLGLAVVVAGAASVTSADGDASPVPGNVVQLIALLSALGYLVAFTPPAWLRRIGQRAVAAEFVRRLALVPGGTRPDDVWQRLLEAAREATNASAVALADRLSDGAAVLKVRRGERANVLPERMEPTAVEALLEHGPDRPVASAASSGGETAAEQGLPYATAIGVGLEGEVPPRALLVLAFADPPLFAEDDLELLAQLGAATAGAVDRELAFARLRRSEGMLAAAQEQAHLGSWEWDIEADTVSWSDELYRIYGLEPQSIPVDYETFLAHVHPDDREWVSGIVRRAFSDHRPFTFEHRVVLPDGGVRTLAAHGTVQTDAVGRPIRMLGTGQDISERKSLEEQLTHQAFHDPLTGLANRALFGDRVQLATFRRSVRRESLAVMLLDLDDFKNVNDSMGHSVGDSLLREIASRIQALVRPSDTVARIGGDEFAVLLEGIPDTGAALAVADKILQAFEEPVVLDGRELTASTSVGIAVNTTSGETADDLIRDADAAMYRAKAGGKGRRELFDPEMHTLVIDRLELRRDLEQAVKRRQLRLLFQPIVDLESLTLMGAEALVRWQHPSRELLLPGTFIPLAEEAGSIDKIGRWVVREACRRAAGWPRRRRSPPVAATVNLSAQQLHNPALVAEVSAALGDANLPPDQLTLEITEGVLVDDPETAVQRLGALKALGVRLAIDDFGTGYSSLSYLTRLPIDILKIDKSFVSSLMAGEEGMTVARIIVELGQALGLQVIAEGVERPEQVEKLLALGCQWGQGYLFAQPLDPGSLDRLMSRSRRIPAVARLDAVGSAG